MKRLIHYAAPAGREPPSHVVAGLRSVDARAELVYFGNGRWILGAVRPSRIRRQKALALLDHEYGKLTHRNLAVIHLGKLALQGFAPIADYTRQGELTWEIVRDFEERDFNYRQQRAALDALLEQKFAELDGTADLQERIRVVRDAAATAGKHAFQFVNRRPRSIVRPAPLVVGG